MECSFAAIHLARSPVEQIRLILGAYLVSGAAFAWLLWRVRNLFRRNLTRVELTLVILAGIGFRLTLIPLNPATSLDVYRYLWEGLIQTHGYSPYILPPSAPGLAPLAREYADTWRSINHPDIPAIYAPTAQVLFRANATAFDGALWGWKLILLFFDTALVIAIAALLRATHDSGERDERGEKPRRFAAPIGVIGVLWCPLLLIETYEAGHLDVIGVSLLVIAFLALTLRRPIAAGVLLGLSLNVKYLWPLLALLVMTRLAANRRAAVAFVVATICAAVLAWVPYWGSFSHAAATARMFAESWTFNDVIFELLRKAPGPRWLAMAVVLATLGALAALLRMRDAGDSPSPSGTPSAGGVWRDVWLISGTALLLGPVAYPWYFMWIVPALATRPQIWLTMWVLAVPALHLVDLHHVSMDEWDPMPWLWLVVGVVPAVLLIAAWSRRVMGIRCRSLSDTRP